MFPLVLPAGTFKERKKIMRTFKVMALTLAGVLSASVANAQDEVEASVSADVVSNYIWRGVKLDDAAIQPSAGISYKGLSLSAWGSYGLTSNFGTTSEFDLTVAYTTGSFNVGITDYWSNSDKYFLYDSHRTSHVFEANVGYDFGPLSVQWFTNFAGADARNDEGGRVYTSYVELNAPFTLGGLDWNATLGFIPYGANYCFYDVCTDSSIALNNLSIKASKDIKVTDTFSIPVFAQVATNPSTRTAGLIFGFTLKP